LYLGSNNAIPRQDARKAALATHWPRYDYVYKDGNIYARRVVQQAIQQQHNKNQNPHKLKKKKQNKTNRIWRNIRIVIKYVLQKSPRKKFLLKFKNCFIFSRCHQPAVCIA
jgi:hypothetical protein